MHFILVKWLKCLNCTKLWRVLTFSPLYFDNSSLVNTMFPYVPWKASLPVSSENGEWSSTFSRVMSTAGQAITRNDKKETKTARWLFILVPKSGENLSTLSWSFLAWHSCVNLGSQRNDYHVTGSGSYFPANYEGRRGRQKQLQGSFILSCSRQILSFATWKVDIFAVSFQTGKLCEFSAFHTGRTLQPPHMLLLQPISAVILIQVWFADISLKLRVAFFFQGFLYWNLTFCFLVKTQAKQRIEVKKSK